MIVRDLKIKTHATEPIDDFVDILMAIVKESGPESYLADVDNEKGKKTAKALRKFAAHL